MFRGFEALMELDVGTTSVNNTPSTKRMTKGINLKSLLSCPARQISMFCHNPSTKHRLASGEDA